MQVPPRPMGDRREMPAPATRVMTVAANNKVLVILVSILAALLIFSQISRLIGQQTLNMSVKSKQYQALFLTNGQVYFGRISRVDDGYVVMKDIYYLQVNQQVQPDQSQDSQNQPSVSLAKLGSELHGPEDVMFVSRQQVLFWENLKDDGKVAQAIKDHKSKE